MTSTHNVAHMYLHVHCIGIAHTHLHVSQKRENWDIDSCIPAPVLLLGSIKNIHLYLNFVFFGFKIAVFFRFNL